MQRRKLEPFEVVTICDHLSLFNFGYPENEIFRKPDGIAFDRLIQRFGLHSIKFGEVSIHNQFYAPLRLCEKQNPYMEL